MTLNKIILLFCFLIQVSLGALHPDEQTILVNWYNSLGSQGSLDWNTAIDLCGQTGVGCNNAKPYQRVTKLEFWNSYLSGTIPAEFESLSVLRILDLSVNGFTGTIPIQLGNLTNLQELYLDGNYLLGTIPTELGRLSNLKTLFFNMNTLSDSNYFEGTIPTEFGGLTMLRILFLTGNSFSGSIPTEFGNLKNLEQLNLQNNHLSGTIPTELGDVPVLRYMEIQSNQLNGTLPTQLGNLKKLQSLYLDNNQLSGPIPTELGNLESLLYMFLNENQLSGSIPTEFGNLTNLFILRLHHNQLSGPIPAQLSRLSQIGYLILSHNQLTGALPSTLKKLPYLYQLELAFNFFECPILAYNQWSTLSDYNIANNECATFCPPNQCPNGKVCSIAYASFSCGCRLGTSGSNCEVSACDSITCQNGGTCFLDNAGNPFCKCQTGYKGDRCQKDLCFPSPCKNGGSGCSHYSGGYGCICPFPFFGDFCEQFNSFASAGYPLAYYPFSEVNKSFDGTENGHNLSPFNAEPMNYPHFNDPMNEALVLFGQDIISTSSQSITLGDNFSITVVFSISKFYLTTSLVILTPNTLADLSSMSLNILSTGALEVMVKGVSRFTSPTSIISLNTLTIVTFSKEGNIWRIIKNNQDVASITAPVSMNITNNRMYLGYNFRGILDKVAIYNFAMNVNSVEYIYDDINPPLTSCGGCMNGGICGKLEKGKKCFCSQCWTGDKCETRINGCLRPCKNGGTYIDGVCHCAAGYTGSQCESILSCPRTMSLPGNFPRTDAYQTVIGSCSSGSGNPSRQCLADGSWQVILNPCI